MTNLATQALTMPWRRGYMETPVALALLLAGAFCYSAWLTSIVFCAAAGLWPLLVASAIFWPIGIVHGFGVWLGGW